ncbi:MAG: apolipoprotein N-acyltransferase [Alphaproteobacteria bacterium]|nr:apolipoprotein N-acyltransferase [Alphaproteobacteria bacterium]
MRRYNISIKQKNFCNRINKFICNFQYTSSFIAGVFLKFAFCKGTTFPPILILSFGLLLKILKISNHPLRIGYLFGIGYFGSTLYWIAGSFECVGLGVFGYPAVIALVLYLSFYTAIPCLLTKKLSKNSNMITLMFPVFWVIFEYVRGYMFTGFPWNLIAYASLDTPYFSQIADLIGAYGVSFILLLIVTLLQSKGTFKYGLAIFLISISYGYFRINISDDFETINIGGEITLVQPSISQRDKIDQSKFFSNLNKLIVLSDFEKSTNKPRLIVWPEASVSLLYHKEQILNYISKHINGQTYLLIGCDYIQNEDLYNGALILNKNGDILSSYEKRHLLPFGEFVPEILLKLGIKKITDGMINFKSGEKSRSIQLNNLLPFNLVICYEAVFPGKIVDKNEGINHKSIIINITNDAWFGDSDGPAQHFRSVCFRAIEEGRPVFRCANNGISCIVDMYGKVINKIKTNNIGALIFDDNVRIRNTLYSRFS